MSKQNFIQTLQIPFTVRLRLSMRKFNLKLDFTALTVKHLEIKLRMNMHLPNITKAFRWCLTMKWPKLNFNLLWSTGSSEPKSTYYLMIKKSLQWQIYQGVSRCRILVQHFYGCCFRLLLKEKHNLPKHYSTRTWKHVAA